MIEGKLVFHEELGRGLVIKSSPSGSLVEVYFKNTGSEVVLSSLLTLLN